jgi:hypothetical protein
MNKHAAEKIASEYYNLGIQLALQNAGLLKTAKPSIEREIENTIGGDAYLKATGGMTQIPLRTGRLRDVAGKYDMSLDEVRALDRKGEQAAEEALRFPKALGHNASLRAFGLPQGTAQVPYRNRN